MRTQRYDMQLLSLRVERLKKEADDVDAEVAQLISDATCDQSDKDKLTAEWIKLTAAEEEKSKSIWSKQKKNIEGIPQRQQESKKVIVTEGRSYVSVAKKGKTASSQDEESEDLPPKEPVTPATGTKEDSSGSKTKAKNTHKKSSGKNTKKDADPKPKNPQKTVPATKTDGRQPSPFQRRGPKYKPKQLMSWGNGWGPWYNQHNQNMWQPPYPGMGQYWTVSIG